MKKLHSLLDLWFPAALVGLFLLALPGLALVVLTLLGEDREINRWLEDNLQISYQLAVSPWVALILLLLPLLLVLLYFLKLKRKSLQVPSTFLWKKSVEDLHVNSLFQWLRQNVLLVLQILAVLFLTYSVLGLRLHGHTSQGRHYILMIDNSASMSTKDVAPSRLEWAKQEALKEIDGAGDDDYGMIIVVNSKASTLQGYTNNRAKLREAVRSIEPTHRPTRIDEALALAESLANPVRSTEDVASQPEGVPEGAERTMVPPKGVSTVMHLYSDGRYQKVSEATLAGLGAREAGSTNALGNLVVHYHRAGVAGPENVNNVGIVGMYALRQSGPLLKAKTPDAQKLQVKVRVANYRPQAVPVKVLLNVFVDGQLFHPDQKSVALEAREVVRKKEADGGPVEEEKDKPGEDTLSFSLPPIDLRANVVVHARLDKINDAFPLDDEAWVVVGTLRKARVLIVGPANAVLDAFFEQEATERLSSVERMPADKLGTEEYRKQARSGQFDLIVFDRCAPETEEDMPLANTYFIDRPPPPWVRGEATYRPPVVIPSKGSHSLLRYITTLSEVRVSEAFLFDVEKNLDPKVRAKEKEGEEKRALPGITRVVESNSQRPLIFSLPRGPYVDVVQAFALVSDKGDLVSDWPLQPSFPLFFRNLLYNVGKVQDAVQAASVQPGEPMVLRPEAGVQALEVTAPGGATAELQRGQRPDFVFGDTDRVGVYHYRTQKEGPARSFAVNLLDANESNVEPRDEIAIGADRVVTGQERPQPRELWKWVLLLAVGLLAVEWMVYTRRVSV